MSKFLIISNSSIKLISEDEYNMSFQSNSHIIIAHKNLMNKVEIADLIFLNNDNLFLTCNKSGFNDPVTRDLLNQKRHHMLFCLIL